MKNSILSILIGINIYYGQSLESIDADRPDLSEGTYILPKSLFQVEGGITYSNNKFSPNVMLRYGLAKSTEIRLETDFGKDILNTDFNDLTFSIKQRIFSNDNYPLLSLIGTVAYDNIEGDNLNIDLLIATSYDLSDNISVVYNLGSNDGFESLKTSLQLEYSLFDKWKYFGEYLGIYSSKIPQHTLATGVKYILKNNLQIDTMIGFPFGRLSDSDNFISFGIAYRFDKNKQ